MRLIAPLLFGLIGTGILVWLGTWQLTRLEWKEGVLSEIEARIDAPPMALPETPDPQTDKYLPVRMTGEFDEGALRVLVSQKQVGAGYRIISPFETEGRRVLIDRGFLKVEDPLAAAPSGKVTINGNLHWPDDRLNSTPENDVAGNTWFARDIPEMSAALETEPLLIIAAELSQPDGALTPLPVDTSGIPNDHLEYAVTWYSLAIVWLVMTGYFIYRTARPAKGKSA